MNKQTKSMMFLMLLMGAVNQVGAMQDTDSIQKTASREGSNIGHGLERDDTEIHTLGRDDTMGHSVACPNCRNFGGALVSQHPECIRSWGRGASVDSINMRTSIVVDNSSAGSMNPLLYLAGYADSKCLAALLENVNVLFTFINRRSSRLSWFVQQCSHYTVLHMAVDNRQHACDVVPLVLRDPRMTPQLINARCSDGWSDGGDIWTALDLAIDNAASSTGRSWEIVGLLLADHRVQISKANVEDILSYCQVKSVKELLLQRCSLSPLLEPLVANYAEEKAKDRVQSDDKTDQALG